MNFNIVQKNYMVINQLLCVWKTIGNIRWLNYTNGMRGGHDNMVLSASLRWQHKFGNCRRPRVHGICHLKHPTDITIVFKILLSFLTKNVVYPNMLISRDLAADRHCAKMFPLAMKQNAKIAKVFFFLPLRVHF